jgi:hypothetical protein
LSFILAPFHQPAACFSIFFNEDEKEQLHEQEADLHHELAEEDEEVATTPSEPDDVDGDFMDMLHHTSGGDSHGTTGNGDDETTMYLRTKVASQEKESASLKKMLKQ